MCAKCNWEHHLTTINEAIVDAYTISTDDGRGEAFAQSVLEKLEDIGKWVEKEHHITDAQVRAVDNMANGIEAWL